MAHTGAIDPRLQFQHQHGHLPPPPPPPPPPSSYPLTVDVGHHHRPRAPHPPSPAAAAAAPPQATAFPPVHHPHPPAAHHPQAHHSPHHHAQPSANAHGSPLYQLHPVNLPRPTPQDPQHVDLSLLHDVDDESAEEDDSGQPSPADPNASGTPGKAAEKRPRACDSCRGLKVKCIIDPASGEPCKRCAKARRQCIVTPPTRKRQKKADGRVAELERKIDALTATLAAREASVFEGGIQLDKLKAESAPPYQQMKSPKYVQDPRLLGNTPNSPRTSDHGPRPNEGPDKRRRIDAFFAERLGTPGSNDAGQMPIPSSDPEGRGSIYNQKKPQVFDHSDIDQRISDIIDTTSAERLFERYITVVAPRFPAVPFPPGTKASQVRREKPILFLAIMSSTSYGTGLEETAQIKLEAELRDVFAKAMWKNGEKSLEIVQALHVATLWYRPPANFEQHMFYQMVHMSAVMAIDIGIGKRLSPWKQKWFGSEPPPLKVPHYYGSIEAKRAWVVCYFLCISITMILRRPILVRFTDYLNECIDILETSEDALPSDKVLCQHVRLAHISEDIATQFAMDDPAINYTMTDRNVSFGIKHYEKALADLREPNDNDYALRLVKHVTNLYLHEIALHSQSNVDDFKGPWIQETFKTAVGDTVFGPEHIQALTACQQSCRDILDTFLCYDFEIVYVLPVIFTGVRVIYAVVVIIKLYIAADSQGEIAGIIKKEDLHVEEYLNKLQVLFKKIMTKDALSPHVKFLWVIERLKDRWQGIKNGKGVGLCRSTGKSTPLGGEEPKKPHGQPSVTSVPAQGLHLLSEAAMNGNGGHQNGAPHSDAASADSALAAASQAQQTQSWYDQSAASNQMAGLPMDPGAYLYQGAAHGYDGFDYGIGSLGMGMDGAISGLFMADGLWGFPQSQDASNPHVFQGWQ